jgi:hypothetical protein
MAGDWSEEVEKKLVDQGVDLQLAAQIAGVAHAEMHGFTANRQAERRPSFWRGILWFLGLSD